MTGRHRPPWFCPTCDDTHPADAQCPAPLVENEPLYLRACWAVYEWSGRVVGDIVRGIRGVRF